MRLPHKDEVIEWAAGGIVSAGIGWATEPKWGVLAFTLYVGVVLASISYQMEKAK